MHVRSSHGALHLETPAKVNLFLEVLARRPDGFHEIETLLLPVSIYDSLVCEPLTSGDLDLHCTWALRPTSAAVADSRYPGHTGDTALPTGRDNLVYQALDLLRWAAGQELGMRVRLTKRIPIGAGLGGGSSDAAAALVAGNRLWGLNYSPDRLHELAARLGSDVPFFLGRGPAICRGRGERIEPIAARSACHLVVARPPVSLATADVYRWCRPADAPRSVRTTAEALARGAAARIGETLHNGLAMAAAQLTPWMARMREEFQRQGSRWHLMSGSGSAWFAICESALTARRLATRLAARRIGQTWVATAGA